MMDTSIHANTTGNNVVPFEFEGAAVRVTDQDGEPWFVLADVCRVLEHTNPSMAASRLDDDEKGVTTVYTPGGDQQAAIINESGLYSLILTSRKPAAKRFKKWVTAEVLPTIRKTGGYSAAPRPQPRQRPTVPETQFKRSLSVAKALGLDGNQAALSANSATIKACGVNVLEAMDLKPRRQGRDGPEESNDPAFEIDTGKLAEEARYETGAVLMTPPA